MRSYTVEAWAEHVKGELGGAVPSVAVVLGSGLSRHFRPFLVEGQVPLSSLDGYPAPTVEGHPGMLGPGEMGGHKLLIVQGRIHGYEGYGVEEITLMVRLLSTLGVETVILTNAAGAIDRNLVPGDLMLIADTINFTFFPPGVPGPSEDLGARGPVMDSWVRRQLEEAAAARGISLKVGVLLGMSGPTYETPAERNMGLHLGANVASMSTVCEARVAARLGMKVGGISCVTNWCPVGLEADGEEGPSHEEVIQVAARLGPRLVSLISEALPRLSEGEDHGQT